MAMGGGDKQKSANEAATGDEKPKWKTERQTIVKTTVTKSWSERLYTSRN